MKATIRPDGDLYRVTLDHGTTETLHYYPTRRQAEAAVPGLQSRVVVTTTDRLERLLARHVVGGGSSVSLSWRTATPAKQGGEKTSHRQTSPSQRAVKGRALDAL
jgi:hypothetical protein